VSACNRCGSFAINPGHHGRLDGVRINLCDVCYWRSLAEISGTRLATADALLERTQRKYYDSAERIQNDRDIEAYLMQHTTTPERPE